VQRLRIVVIRVSEYNVPEFSSADDRTREPMTGRKGICALCRGCTALQ